MRSLLTLCVFLYLVGVIQAANTTSTTTISDYDGFEAPQLTTRTMASIVSSSVLTLFACIYSAVHPNIPSPKDSPLVILRRRLGIIIMALIAPELIVTWAMRQWISAYRVTRQFKESGYFEISRAQEESKNHGSIAATAERYVEGYDSTRFLIAHPKDSTPGYGGTHALVRPFKKLLETYVLEQSEDYTWTQKHSFFVLMGGFMLYENDKPCHALQPDQVLELIRNRCIDVPALTENQIHDRSKGNAISKGLIMLQVVWFIMQLITRHIYNLEITQLEVGTLAFAVLNFLTYAVWWNKPLNVQCPHPVYWKSTESRPENYINFDERDQFAGYKFLAPVIRPIAELVGEANISTSRKLRVPTFDGSIELSESDHMILMIVALIMATIFGSIHCMAFFVHFPAHHEQVLWIMSTVAIICTPWLYCFGYLTGIFVVRGTTKIVSGVIFCLPVMLYITARALLLVLLFTTLLSLPLGAYQAVLWTNLFPHL